MRHTIVLGSTLLCGRCVTACVTRRVRILPAACLVGVDPRLCSAHRYIYWGRAPFARRQMQSAFMYHSLLSSWVLAGCRRQHPAALLRARLCLRCRARALRMRLPMPCRGVPGLALPTRCAGALQRPSPYCEAWRQEARAFCDRPLSVVSSRPGWSVSAWRKQTSVIARYASFTKERRVTHRAGHTQGKALQVSSWQVWPG